MKYEVYSPTALRKNRHKKLRQHRLWDYKATFNFRDQGHLPLDSCTLMYIQNIAPQVKSLVFKK